MKKEKRNRRFFTTAESPLSGSIKRDRSGRIQEGDEERFVQIVENAPVGIVILDRDGKITFANTTAEEILGLERSNFAGRSYNDPAWKIATVDGGPFHDEDLPFSRVMATGKEVRGIEHAIEHPDGTRVILSINAAPQYDSGGNVIGVIASLRDITEQRKAQSDLRESETRFRELFDNMSSGVAVYEATGGGEDFLFKDFNRASEKINRIKREDVIGRSVLEVFPGVREFGLFEVFQRVYRTGEPELFPVTLYKDERISGWRENYVYKLPSGDVVAVYDDVTERKRAEQELRDSQAMIRRIMDTTPNIIYIYDLREKRNVYINRKILDLLGFSPQQIQEMGDSIIDQVIYEDDREKVAAYFERFETMPAGEVLELEYRQVNAKGESRWFFSRTTVFSLDDDGKPLQVLGEVQDINERKQAEDALRESEERYRELAESIGDVFFAMDRDLRYTYWNRATEKLTGIAAEEALGRTFYDIFPDIRETAADEIYRDAITSGEPRTFVERYSLQGDEYFFEINAYPTRSGLSVFARNITGRRRSERRLAMLNQCLLNLGADPQENIDKIVADGLIILDGELLKYWRLEGDEYKCHIVHGRAEGYEPMDRSVPRTRFEELFLWFSGPVAAAGPGKVFLGDVDRDIGRYGIKTLIGFPVTVREQIIGCLCLLGTDEGGFSREDVELVGMLARAVSIEEERWIDEIGLRDFIDIASHELRHPITVMKGYAITLQEMEERMDDESRRDMLASIDRGADRLDTLLKELLDTTHIERGKFTITRREVPLRAIVDATLLEIKGKHERNTINTYISEDIGPLNVDPRKTSQLLVILLDNAAKFSPAGSEIEIRADLEEGEAVVSVLDRGEGVPEHERDRIFWRFYQVGDPTHHSIPGIGLGLYIAKRIVEAHGGRIWCEPREGGGSSFRFALPVT